MVWGFPGPVAIAAGFRHRRMDSFPPIEALPRPETRGHRSRAARSCTALPLRGSPTPGDAHPPVRTGGRGPGLLTCGLLGLWLILAPLRTSAGPTPRSLPDCLGDTRSLIISSGMPYTPVRVQGRTGFFVIDLGADGSAISPGTFLGGKGPSPEPGSSDRFRGFDFFGPWSPLRLNVQDHSGITGPVPQAGLIGTDLLRQHVVTIDYAGGLLHRSSPADFCDETTLRDAGFRSISSRGYYGSDPRRLSCPAAPPGSPCPNIPTIPVRIGSSTAVAQIDTGYDDGRFSPSMNINRAWLRQLLAAGVPLERFPPADLTLSTCSGVAEPVLAYRLPPGRRVDVLAGDGAAAFSLEGVTLFLKDTPAEARRCGGIGTWRRPAAQLGAGFVNSGTLVVDPVAQRVWFRPPQDAEP